MNKSFRLFSLLLISMLTESSRAETLKWDFSKGINPLDSPMKFSRSDAAEIKGGALRLGNISRTAFEGIISEEKYPLLTPQGSFRISFEITMGTPRNHNSLMFLWDSKRDYLGDQTGDPQKNSGLTIGMYRTPDGKVIVPRAWLGFGTRTADIKGLSFSPIMGKKHILEFFYNGSGLAAFYIDGKLNKEIFVVPGGPIAPAKYKTAIGNRSAGIFFGFDGKLHSIKISTGKAETLEVKSVGRNVFQRGERDASLQVEIRNVSQRKTAGLNPGEKKIIAQPVNTNLAVGKYQVNFYFEGKSYAIPYSIAPIAHDKLIVMMWGFSDSFRILQKSGFTHQLSSLVSRLYWRPRENPKERIIAELDEMYAEGFFFSDYFTIPHFPSISKKYPRLKRDGSPYLKLKKMNIDANNPEAVKDMRRWAEKFSAVYEKHPAVQMLDICSEIRDWTAPSFTVYERDACKQATGADIPAIVEAKNIHYQQIPGFPSTRIIPENHPVLAYYRWFWTSGDGWNPMFSMIADGYRKHMHSNFQCYFAPATRQPPIRGAGGNADILGQWTYSNPEPQILAASADELLAVANGKPVIQGTQLILYRSLTAPKGVKISPEPTWLAEESQANYITNPPDTLIQSIWATLSRPVYGMIFHGDGSFYPAPVKGTPAYRMTNEQSEPAFRKLMHEVVIPLGPTLKRIQGKPSQTAVLHSFTSSVLALRGSYGVAGWLMNLHIALQCAGFDPHVIYEEDVLEGRLKDVKILFLSHCDVLTESIYKKLNEFQLNGGIIVADETVPPAILPNLRFHTIANVKDALENKKNLVSLGKLLRKKIASHYTPSSETSTPDLISHLRDNYLFVINDKRTYGNYVGQWKKFAEKALPNTGTITVNRKVGAVYDLVNRKPAPFRIVNGKTVIPVHFDGPGGKLFLLEDRPLQPLVLTVRENGNVTADTGTTTTIPVQLSVRDASGKETDDSHYAPAVNGKFHYQIHIPQNAAKGQWTVEVKRLPDNAAVQGSLAAK